MRSASGSGPTVGSGPRRGPGKDVATVLDLTVHAHDLAVAVGEPSALDEDSPAVQQACGYLLRLVPQLFAKRTGADEGDTLRVAVRGVVEHEATAVVRRGQGLWRPEPADTRHWITGTPTALILLLSGRDDPERWRDHGALAWSGARRAVRPQRTSAVLTVRRRRTQSPASERPPGIAARTVATSSSPS